MTQYPADACPECHRRPGWHGPKCSKLLAAKHTVDEELVAKAWGIYLRALGRDPLDKTGLVSQARRAALAVAREFERRRLVKDAAETKATWDAIRAAKHGPLYDVARSIWYGFPMTGAPEVLYPALDDEVHLTHGEWFDWVGSHKKASADSMIDHLASIIPPNEGETYVAWRDRLKARRRAWATETDAVVVNRTLYAPLRRAGSPSPATSRTGGGQRARKRRPR